MQASKRISVLNIASVQRNFTRNSPVSTASFAKDDDQLKSWHEIPGPWKLPFIGQAHHFIPPGALSDFTKMQDILYKKYGPLVKLDAGLGRPPMLFVYDPEAAAFVLRGENLTPVRPGFQSLEYYRKKYKTRPKEETRPTGLISDHGDLWKTFRSAVNPTLMQPKTIRLYTSQVDEVAQDMIKRMKSIRNKENMLEGDFMNELNKWSLESIGVIALGGRLNCFDPNLPKDSPVRRLIQCVHDIFSIANELDFKPSLWKFYETKAFKKAMKLYQEQEELAAYFINKSRKEMLTNKKPDDEKGVLEKLLETDERIALIMACDMLFAGVDTVATQVAAIFYLLATNQEKQDKLRHEITSEDSRKYLKACIKESIRILPVVSGNMRNLTKDYEIMGYRIPKGTNIVTCHQYMCLMESQFPRAQEYVPERWIEDGPLSYKNADPFAYNPFGFGIRSCVGRRIAELEMETLLSRVIQNFKVEWTGPPPQIKPSSLNYFAGPYGYIFKDL